MSGERRGPWRMGNRRTVYDNPWIEVIDHEVFLADDSPRQYGVVHFKNRAIGVLPILADGTVPLVGQHRFPTNTYSWELPEGGGPLDEDPLASAKRELREETGYTAENWQEIASFDLSNSVTDEASICYLAWDLTPGAPAPEESEAFSYERITFSALHERVLSGNIRDSLTVIMVLTATELARQNRLPQEVARILLGSFGP